MTFDEWAVEYFGELCDVPEACRDAGNAGAGSEREACAKVCEAEAAKWEGDGEPEPMSRICAAAIRAL